MYLDLKEIWENDDNLQSTLNGFTAISDTLRGPIFDVDQRNKYLFSQVVRFVQDNKVYFDKIIEQAEKPEKDLGDKEEVK